MVQYVKGWTDILLWQQQATRGYRQQIILSSQVSFCEKNKNTDISNGPFMQINLAIKFI